MFDGSEPGERQLLFAHGLIEGGVIGGHGQQFGAVADRLAQGPIEDDLPAGGHADRHPGKVDDAAASARDEVSGTVGK